MPDGTIYTCPMHPEVRQVGPGSCPICGMALEPVLVAAETPPNPELVDMTRRFWIGLLLALPVATLQMGGHFAGFNASVGQSLSNLVQLVMGDHFPALQDWIRPNISNIVQMVLGTPVVLWAGWPFFVRGWRSFVARKLNMFSLISAGTGVAWVYSVVATLAPGLFPAAFRGHEGTVAVYFEAAAGITVLVLLGQMLELRARERTSGAIRALLDLAPKTARQIADDGSEVEIPLDRVMVDNRLRVRPGEKVPVDGIVIDGRSSIDESMITGESMPVTKAAGTKVIAGTLNQSGSFLMRAEKVGRDTLLAQIVQMVAAAQRVARADPAARRSSLVVVCPLGHRCSPAYLRHMVRLWTGAALHVCACRGGERAHHRLPVRARVGHADVDHGRRGPWRTRRRAGQER